MLLFGLLSSVKILATDTVLEEMSGGESITTKMRDNTTFQQQLVYELAAEIEVARALSLRSIEFFKEYREAFLFDDQSKIRDILHPEHPYRINMVQLCQAKIRINDLEQQLESIHFPGAQYLFYTVNFSFPKPNPNRWVMLPPLWVDSQFNIDQ